jgi:hypothetical protein
MPRIARSPTAKPTKPRRRRRSLDAVPATSAGKIRHQKGDLTGELLIAAMKASPHRDVDIDPERGPMPTRHVVL